MRDEVRDQCEPAPACGSGETFTAGSPRARATTSAWTANVSYTIRSGSSARTRSVIWWPYTPVWATYRTGTGHEVASADSTGASPKRSWNAAPVRSTSAAYGASVNTWTS